VAAGRAYLRRVTSTSAWSSRLLGALPGLAVSVVAGVVFLVQGFQGSLGRDLAIFAYAGQRVADGAAPYVDIVNRSGPLSHLVPGMGMLAGRHVGLDDVLAARITCWALSVAAVYVTFRTARTLLGSTPLAAATALTLVMITGFVEYAARGPRDKTVMVLFLVLALDSIVRRRWARAGAFVSLTTLTWQPAFFPAVVTALVVLALQRQGRLSGLVRLTAGGLAPLAACVIWYAAIGQLRAFVDCFVLIHARYTQQSGFLDNPGRNWQNLVDMYDLSLGALVLGLAASLVAAVVAAVRMVRDRTGRTPQDVLLLGLGAGTATSLLWVLRAHNQWPDLYFVYPFAALGVGVTLRSLTDAVGKRGGAGSAPRPRIVTWAVAAAWCTASVLIGGQYALDHRFDRLDAQRARVEHVLDALDPGATVQSFQAPAPLVLAGRTNPTRHQMFALGLDDYVDDVLPGGLSGIGEALRRDRPTLLVVQQGFAPPWLRPARNEGYTLVGADNAGGYDFFVLDDLGPAVIERARQAAGRRA
jgi:hypothetical protein